MLEELLFEIFIFNLITLNLMSLHNLVLSKKPTPPSSLYVLSNVCFSTNCTINYFLFFCLIQDQGCMQAENPNTDP